MALDQLENSEINNLAGTVDTKSGAPYSAFGSTAYFYELLNAIYWLSMAGANDCRVDESATAATTVYVFPGRVELDGVAMAYAGGEVDLSTYDDDTAYVWLYSDGGTATLGAGTDAAGWPATAHIKLAEVTLASSVITAIVDRRKETMLQRGSRSDAINALTPTDGNFIVGNGTTWVAESGDTALASAGLTATAAEVNQVCDGIAASNNAAALNAVFVAGVLVGTTGTTFQIDNDNSGPALKNVSGAMQARNAADDGYVTLSVATPTAAEHAVTKSYVDAAINGLDWQESVLDEIDLTAAEPAAPDTGDRYLNTGTGDSSETTQAVTANYIYQWDGSTWTEIVPDEGTSLRVEDSNLTKVFNGAAWVGLGTGLSFDDIPDGSTYYKLTGVNSSGLAPRSSLIEEELAVYRLGLHEGHLVDGTQDFSVVRGGWGSGGLYLQTTGASGFTATADWEKEFSLPPEYVAAGDIQLVITAKYTDGGGANIGTTTIDAEVYKVADDGTVGSDLCATAVQSITSSYDAYTFTVTPTGLAPGDKLLIIVREVVQELDTSGTLYGNVANVELQLDIKG